MKQTILSDETRVIDGKLCISKGGCRVWFTLDTLDDYVVKLEGDLEKWKARRKILADELEKKKAGSL